MQGFTEYIKTERTSFANHFLTSNWSERPVADRVAIENLLIAFDQMAERLRKPDGSLLKLCQDVRTAQKKYFRTRSGKDLDEARKLERDLDELIAVKKEDAFMQLPQLFP